MNVAVRPGLVPAELYYLVNDGQKPRTYVYDPPDGEPRTTAHYAPHPVQIADARRTGVPFELDREGFALVTEQSAVRDFWDEDEVRRVYYPEADALLRGRVQVINVWRPIVGPLWDSPLAVCDARTVRPEHLIAADLIFPDRVGETYAVAYDPEQRWFYFPGMAVEEALLIKCYDSVEDGRARFAPHSAFVDPTAPLDAPRRQSIELRAFVFHHADDRS